MSSILRNYCEKNGREKEEMRDMAAERESMLIMKNVSKTFNPGTVNEKCALDGVNLTLGAGDFATIVGSNGAGKSTLFNAITGAFFPDRGLIMLGGEDITYQQEHVRSKGIGHLFQDPLKGTAPHMTIEENMALAYLRTTTSRNAYFSRINAADKKKFREQLGRAVRHRLGRLSYPRRRVRRGVVGACQRCAAGGHRVGGHRPRLR